jgi:hypothetical protein
MRVFQGTTPYIEVVFNEDTNVLDVTGIDLRLIQGSLVVCRKLSDMIIDVSSNSMYFRFSEDETRSFSGGVITLQLKYTLKGSDDIIGREPEPIKIVPMYDNSSFRG